MSAPDIRERVAGEIQKTRMDWTNPLGGPLAPPSSGDRVVADRILSIVEQEERAEVTKLREALRWCAEAAWEGSSIEGYDFQDMMEREGLMVEVPADEAFREEWDSDTMYVLAWSDLARSAPTGAE